MTQPGSYTITFKEIGVTSNPCIFIVPEILVRRRDFSVDALVTNPICNNGKGSIKLTVNDVRPQYYYTISQNNIDIETVGPVTSSNLILLIIKCRYF
jgi:acetolactate synthase regulatory subunit